jgi:SAM-dependent methyltransferase
MQCTNRFSACPTISFEENFKPLPNFVYRQALHCISASFSPYHPVHIGGTRISQGERSCADRWQIIESEISACNAATVLDLGCAEGYFVQKAASACGCLALGVDGDARRLSLAHASILLNKVKGAGFLYADITPELISQLPVHDVVLFQSVLHHMMYSSGIDYAREVLVRLRPKIGKLMIFDMGQSDETNNDWATKLPDMGNSPHGWIEEFLRSAGYTSVEKLGDTDSYRSATKRALFRLLP